MITEYGRLFYEYYDPDSTWISDMSAVEGPHAEQTSSQSSRSQS